MTRRRGIRWLALAGSLAVVVGASPGWAARSSITGSLVHARESAVATTLADGRVLVVGGSSGNGALKTAEIYNPANGTWRSTASLARARYESAAVTLHDGRVLVIGGMDPTAASLGQLSESTEIYTPSSGTWRAGPSTNAPHVGAAVTTLKNGMVLVAGGSATDVSQPGISETWLGAGAGAAEIYDPATSTWHSTGSMLVNDSLAHALLLPDGRVFTGCGTSPSDFEIYTPGADPTGHLAGLWQLTRPVPAGLAECAMSRLPDGRILVAGGLRYENAALSQVGTGNGVRVGGGSVLPSATSVAFLYDPATDTWTSAVSMSTPRAGATATLLHDGRVLVTGGVDDKNVALRTTEIFDSRTSRWVAWTSTPQLQAGRACCETTTLLHNGTVLIAGGMAPDTAATGSAHPLREAEIVRL